MGMTKDDEIRRSKMWRIVFVVSSVLIVLIAVFFLRRLFTANPLEGRWESEDGNFAVSIGPNGGMTISLLDMGEETDVDVKVAYTFDKEEKTITIRADEKELRELAEKSDGAYSEEALKNALASLLTTFDYSVASERLTLTEREYGEQLTFIRKS